MTAPVDEWAALAAYLRSASRAAPGMEKMNSEPRRSSGTTGDTEGTTCARSS